MRDRGDFWEDGWKGHLSIFDSRSDEGVPRPCWDLMIPVGHSGGRLGRLSLRDEEGMLQPQ